MRHDLVAGLDQIIGHFFRADLSQAEVRLGINQAGVNGHAGHVNHARVAGHAYRASRADGGDLAVLHYDCAVVDSSVRDGQQLAAAQHNGLRRSGLLLLRRWSRCLLIPRVLAKQMEARYGGEDDDQRPRELSLSE